MKLLTPTEVMTTKASELARDAARIDATRNTLKSLQTELDTAKAKFDSAMASQKAEWAKEEESHSMKIADLQAEVLVLEKRRSDALIPIEAERQRAHDLFKEAEAVLEEVRVRKGELSTLIRESEDRGELLAERMDEFSEKLAELEKRELSLEAREKSNLDERNFIRSASSELTSKLQELWHRQEHTPGTAPERTT